MKTHWYTCIVDHHSALRCRCIVLFSYDKAQTPSGNSKWAAYKQKPYNWKLGLVNFVFPDSLVPWIKKKKEYESTAIYFHPFYCHHPGEGRKFSSVSCTIGPFLSLPKVLNHPNIRLTVSHLEHSTTFTLWQSEGLGHIVSVYSSVGAWVFNKPVQTFLKMLRWFRSFVAVVVMSIGPIPDWLVRASKSSVAVTCCFWLGLWPKYLFILCFLHRLLKPKVASWAPLDNDPSTNPKLNSFLISSVFRRSFYQLYFISNPVSSTPFCEQDLHLTGFVYSRHLNKFTFLELALLIISDSLKYE